VAETTALGAAYAAGLAVGFWKNTDEMRQNWGMDKTWQRRKDAKTLSVKSSLRLCVLAPLR
jgi:glycerol kinase